MDLDDLLEEFKDEHQVKKAAAVKGGKNLMSQQDSPTFSNGSGVQHGHSKFGGNHAEDDPWGNIPSSKVAHGGLVPPKQIYA